MSGTVLQPLAYTVIYVTFFFGLVSFLLRFYSRIFVLNTWGWDDWLAIVSLSLETLSTTQQLQIIKWLFIEEVMYYSVYWVIRCSFLLFYLRLSSDETFTKFVYLGMLLNAAIFIINILLACLQCVPFDEIIHPGAHPNATCINKLVLLIVPSILNIIADLYVLILPISTVWNLQMSLRRKIAILVVIGFGACAVIIAFFRLIPLVELNSSPDPSYVLGKMVVVAALEIQFAVIAINLPSLKALWMNFTGARTVSSGQGYSAHQGYKLSSLGKRSRGMPGLNTHLSEQERSAKRKGSIGSITQLQRGTESERELSRHSGTVSRLPTQGILSDERAIMVTTDIDMRSLNEQDMDLPPHRV